MDKFQIYRENVITLFTKHKISNKRLIKFLYDIDNLNLVYSDILYCEVCTQLEDLWYKHRIAEKHFDFLLNGIYEM
jgi:hypothetical protein